MPLYALDEISPTLSEGAWVAPSADLIGGGLVLDSLSFDAVSSCSVCQESDGIDRMTPFRPYQVNNHLLAEARTLAIGGHLAREVGGGGRA